MQIRSHITIEYVVEQGEETLQNQFTLCLDEMSIISLLSSVWESLSVPAWPDVTQVQLILGPCISEKANPNITIICLNRYESVS